MNLTFLLFVDIFIFPFLKQITHQNPFHSIPLDPRSSCQYFFNISINVHTLYSIYLTCAGFFYFIARNIMPFLPFLLCIKNLENSPKKARTLIG